MINIKKIEPKVSSGKRVISVKDAYINEDGVLCDGGGEVFKQLKPELPSDISINFKISYEIEGDDDPDAADTDEGDGLPF